MFEVDRRGRTVAVHRLGGSVLDVEAVDVEDMALGPGPTLYVGDIGDNRAVRRTVAVLRVPESFRGPVCRTALTYEAGPHDAEALLVHPRTGQVLVVTKDLLQAGVYAAPLPLSDGVLRRVGTVRLSSTGTPGGPPPQALAQLLVTGAAVSPDGSRVAVRTYTDAYVFPVPGDDLVRALAGTPVVVPLPATPQGEALTWTRDGSALLTSSEGRRAPVHRVPVPAPKPGAGAPGAPAPASGPPAATPPASRPPAAAEPAAAAGVGSRWPLLLAAAPVVLLVALVVRRSRRE